GFLRQLSVYGDTQLRAAEPVDVNEVLRDLEPVLKRVAGEQIELQLPKKVPPLTVDADVVCVERVLVNLAAYGRARMPSGGRLIVELGRTILDRSFVAKHPTVRQGAHALITVKEVKSAASQNRPIGMRESVDGHAVKAASDTPGVDLGTLQTLIRD